MLKEKVSKIENQMREALAEVRETFQHRGVKGTITEDIFAGFLRQYIPRRLEVGNGEIVDSYGNRSGQADIIIVNEDHPFTFTPNKPGLFFIEGVQSIGEIKTALTTQELKSTLKNAALYKKLKTTHGHGSQVHANKSDLARYYEHPPFFLFAYESQISLETIKANIEKYMAENSLGLTDGIDAVFVLDKGWIINFGDGKGAFQFRNPNGDSIPGWSIKNSSTVLFDLFGYLSSTMPKIIRFQPILTNYFYGENKGNK